MSAPAAVLIVRLLVSVLRSVHAARGVNFAASEHELRFDFLANEYPCILLPPSGRVLMNLRPDDYWAFRTCRPPTRLASRVEQGAGKGWSWP